MGMDIVCVQGDERITCTLYMYTDVMTICNQRQQLQCTCTKCVCVCVCIHVLFDLYNTYLHAHPMINTLFATVLSFDPDSCVSMRALYFIEKKGIPVLTGLISSEISISISIPVVPYCPSLQLMLMSAQLTS